MSSQWQFQAKADAPSGLLQYHQDAHTRARLAVMVNDVKGI